MGNKARDEARNRCLARFLFEVFWVYGASKKYRLWWKLQLPKFGFRKTFASSFTSLLSGLTI